MGPGEPSYYPLNLPAEFQEEGARVHVEGFLKDYRVATLPAVEVITVRRLP